MKLPLIEAERKILQEGEVVYALLPGGGRASPWIVLKSKPLTMRSVLTNRDLQMDCAGEREEDTRLWATDPNPPLLSWEEFCEQPTDTRLFIKRSGKFEYGWHLPVETQAGIVHCFQPPGRGSFPIYPDSWNDPEFRVWIDTFYTP